jgi:hypothetical protein
LIHAERVVSPPPRRLAGNGRVAAHHRSTRGSRLARRTDLAAAAALALKSPKRSERVEPINTPPAKYESESESGRMSYVNGWS